MSDETNCDKIEWYQILSKVEVHFVREMVATVYFLHRGSAAIFSDMTLDEISRLIYEITNSFQNLFPAPRYSFQV